MWELDQKEGWVLKKWCFWTVVLEKTLESPLDCKEIQPVNPKGNCSWIFIGRTDAEAEAPILWSPNAKSWLITKDPDAGKDWRQEVKGMTKDEIVGWHHWLNGHEFEQVPGDSAGQGSLAWYSPWGCRVGHGWVTEQQPYVLPPWKCFPFPPEFLQYLVKSLLPFALWSHAQVSWLPMCKWSFSSGNLENYLNMDFHILSPMVLKECSMRKSLVLQRKECLTIWETWC